MKEFLIGGINGYLMYELLFNRRPYVRAAKKVLRKLGILEPKDKSRTDDLP